MTDLIEVESTSACLQGLIIPEFVENDMKFEYNYPILTIGTISDNYWSGQCTLYDRDTKFEIKDLAGITEFTLKEVGFDDYLHIKINDNAVYIGPFGGDRLELVNKTKGQSVTTDGVNRYSCELNTSWHKIVNVDLTPYLKEGTNSILTRTLVSGYGDSWLSMSVKLTKSGRDL